MKTPISSRTPDLRGQRFGQWRVLTQANNKGKDTAWWCRCSCGLKFVVRATELRLGKTTKCIECHKHTSKHRMVGTKTYTTWSSMINRCTNPNDSKHKDYGERGIKICRRWMDFRNFYADMGERPTGQTLDRIDNDGNYEPSNCKWSTNKEQARNRRTSRLLTHDGRTQTLVEWSEETGLLQATICTRIRNLGWSVERALTTPPRRRLEA